MRSLAYRPDIDGLRAIAVLLVLLFHAGLGIQGGFIGVDVFFVISGFLITGIIDREQRLGRFSITHFVSRRIRRIYPAVFMMVLLVIVVGAVAMLPEDFAALAGSALCQQLMLSNFYFWRNTGYFAPDSELMPLLHTWSLAIEEQFYLALPLVMIACRRLERQYVIQVLVWLAIASFVGNVWMLPRSPSATFYLLPTRAWELLTGGVAGLIPVTLFARSKWASEIVAGAGMLAIAGSAAAFGPDTPFPGIASLLPVAGTAGLLVARGETPTFVHRCLSHRWLVMVGVMSYSLYLWHWPVLVFGRYILGPITHVPGRLLLAGLAFPLAYLSWRFVETPFRTNNSSRTFRSDITALAVTSVVIIAVCTWIVVAGGLPTRFSSSPILLQDRHVPARLEANLADLRRGIAPRLGQGREHTSNPSVLVWGDSHAMAAAPAIDEVLKEAGLTGVIVARTATAPLVGYRRTSQSEELCEFGDLVVSMIREKQIKLVVLVGKWRFYATAEGELCPRVTRKAKPSSKNPAETLEVALRQSIAALNAAGAQVLLMGQVPLSVSGNPQLALARHLFLGQPLPVSPTKSEYDEQFAVVQGVMDRLVVAEPAVSYVDPAPMCFDTEGHVKVFSEQGVYYQDRNHLSPLGARVLVKPLIRDKFRGQDLLPDS